MRSISSWNLRNCFRPPTAIVPTRPSNAFVLVCSKKMLKCLANSDSYLKPFKCVTIGHDRAGALVIGVEGFNYINQPVSGDMNTKVNKRTQCGCNNCRERWQASYATRGYQHM